LQRIDEDSFISLSKSENSDDPPGSTSSLAFCNDVGKTIMGHCIGPKDLSG